ncbi:acyl-CoA dehydrogenase family protein [Peribacillus simplex]
MLDHSTKYATEREQFNVPIIDHQAVSQMIAELARK